MQITTLVKDYVNQAHNEFPHLGNSFPILNIKKKNDLKSFMLKEAEPSIFFSIEFIVFWIMMSISWKLYFTTHCLFYII